MIEVSAVSKVYDSSAGSVEVLNGLDLQVASGEAISIVGPSGSGKTTLLNILGTLDKPTSGAVKIGDQVITELDEINAAQFRNQTIGFIFQLHYLLPQCSVLENVLVPRLAGGWTESAADSQARAEALLKEVGLKDRITHKPFQLSGGEQLRVAIARSLINTPKIILADEPTGSLDPVSGERVADLLLETNLSKGVALVVVTHNATLAGKMQKTYRLEGGKLG
ncbi:MAG: lipoprotein-releasing system ATP-binding protein LolD [Opitutaceae bacterium]|nr:lipoprotein-releasing system ATP-binding protein LolD [Opitutaceae bacterium]|tara:strand:+ start:6034 stop:6702 length:669 start_codon:yes stop_codon:yes gene_type:complete